MHLMFYCPVFYTIAVLGSMSAVSSSTHIYANSCIVISTTSYLLTYGLFKSKPLNTQAVKNMSIYHSLLWKGEYMSFLCE